MNRRQFLVMAQALGLSVWLGDAAFAQSMEVRVRKSVTTSAAAADIETLRKGVALLRNESDATRYESWMYWANSHGVTTPVPPAMRGVWEQCHHGTPHFLTWHRAYVVFLEALIRELTQKEDFAMPYWDWYQSSDIPKTFLDETMDSATNPLFNSRRAFSRRNLLTGHLRQKTFSDFQSMLEGNPHGTVHVMVGGDMGRIATAGRDPVFWAHHTNIDRMWSVWLAGDNTRRNENDTDWLQESFAYDVEGNKVLKVSDMLDTKSLGYRYDSTEMTGPTDPVPKRPAELLIVPEAVQPQISDTTTFTLSSKPKLRLSGKSVNLQLKVPNHFAEPAFTMAADTSGRGGRLYVTLNGIRPTELGRERGFEYRVYLNLPEKLGGQFSHEDYYLGVINSFLLSHHDSYSSTVSFELNTVAKRQAVNKSWNARDINLSLISDAEDPQVLVEIESIDLIMALGEDK